MIHTRAIRNLSLTRCPGSTFHVPQAADGLCPECARPLDTSKRYATGFAYSAFLCQWIRVQRAPMDLFEEGELTARLLGPPGMDQLPRGLLPLAEESWIDGFRTIVPEELPE